MAKKRHHHQSVRSRLAESRGEEHHMMHESMGKYHEGHHSHGHHSDHIRHHDRMGHSLGKEHYAGSDPRRRQELEDAGMIHEDHSAVANLPQHVVMKPYPAAEGYSPEELDDTLRGIDHQMGYDNHQKLRNMVPKKV